MKFLIASLLTLLTIAVSAAVNQPIPDEHIYRPLLGKRVIVDALVWHHIKGVAGRVVLPSGDRVYVRDPWIHRRDRSLEPRLPAGKLVRLVGVLTYKTILAARPDVQGYGQPFSHFALDLESFTVIDRAEEEYPKLHPK